MKRISLPHLFGSPESLLACGAALLCSLPSARALESAAVFNEVMYHPAAPAAAEWIELYNQMAVDLDLSAWTLSGGVTFTFPPGTTLPAGAYLLVANIPAALPSALGPWSGSLANSGESLKLKNRSGRIMDQLEYSDRGRWPLGADGSGASLSKRNPSGSGTSPEAWSASWQVGGTPGESNFPNAPLLGPAQSHIAPASDWIYLQGTDLGENWAQSTYAAATGGWRSGPGAFAFEDTPPLVPLGTNLADPSTSPLPICYFQTSFTFSGVPAQTQLSAKLLLDDGAALYLNGHEVARHNLPSGPLSATTRATAPINQASFVTIPLPSQWLAQGSNRLSVSLHDAPIETTPPPGLTLAEEGGTSDPPANLALATRGALAFAKDLLPGYAPTHTIPNLNNGSSGNPSSWIGNSTNSFCGINLGPTPLPLASFAFARDNTAAFTDRTSGTYTVQYTTSPNPSAATPSTAWTTIGILTYGAAVPPTFNLPSLRHRYRFPTVAATGLRLICSTSGICIDELELYGPSLPDLTFDLALSSREILPLPSDNRLVIIEISAATDPLFRVDLQNQGPAPLSLADCKLGPFSLPPQTLAPGALVVFDETQLGFRPRDGDRLFLYAAAGRLFLDAALVGPRPRARYQNRLLTPAAPTFGAENAVSLASDIVINEIMHRFPPQAGSPAIPGTTASTVLLPLDAPWRFHSANIDLGPTWAQSAHPAGLNNWSSGSGLLGFTTLPNSLPAPLLTPFVSSAAPTCYFETDFTLTPAQLASLAELRLEWIVDDGAACYLNGSEITSLRTNLPPGPNVFSSLATASIATPSLSTPKTIPLLGLPLQVGLNRLSIEVHNQTTTGTDLICGARLSALTYTSPPTAARPITSDPEQWIELYHRGTSPRRLDGWQLDGAIHFTFPPNTIIEPGQCLVVARDAAALQAKWPEIAPLIRGNFSGTLRSSNTSLRLEDDIGNPADEVSFLATDRSDGGGSSLELRDPRSDNAPPTAWADSDETARSSWQTFRYRLPGSQKFGPTTWNEMRLGLLDAGECLIDDLSVRANPDSTATQVIQNGTFEALPAGSKWRFLGNHRSSSVIEEPGQATNHVLHLSASGPTETNHNHAESTLVSNLPLAAATTYEVSFRARWLSGTNQLNTRASYQKLARTHELPIPARLGTPGRTNSRFLPNAGPTLTSLNHTPAAPAPGTPVTVSCAASDPDQVAAATLYYRLNAASLFTALPMTPSADRWSADLPGQALNTIAQFYIQATDASGAVSFSPPRGPDSRALLQWTNAPTSSLPAHQLQLIMLPADRDFLLAPLNRLSNERQPATLVYRSSEVFYDAAVRLQGTAAGRVRDGDDYVGYDIALPPEHLFRGLHETIGIDRSGRSPVVRQQDEIYVRHTFHQAGLPCPIDDLCSFIAPLAVHNGTAILQLASYSGLWAESQFDRQGTVFNYDITYEPTSTSTPTNPETLKPAVPFIHVSTDLLNLGDDKEQYRGPFDIRAGKRRDDYSGLIKLCQTMALDNTQLTLQAPQVLDLDEVLRCTALVNLWGIGDTYYTGGLPHNIRFFTPDDATAIQFLPWDMDFVMSGAANAALIPTGNNLGKLITNIPAHRRLYLGHIRHLCATVFKSSSLAPWLAHYGSVVGQNYASTASYLDARSSFAATQYPAAAPFVITTNNGADFAVASNQVILDGTGWIDIHHLRRAGSQDPLTLTWISNTTWRASLPLLSGPNPISLEAYDFSGTLLATRSLTITNTLTEPTLRDALRLTELHYHPANPSTPAELAASTSAGDFEFLELKNLSPQTLRLQGLHASGGLTFTAPDQATLSGGQFGVLVRHRAAFAARYGTAIPILGEFPSAALSNQGESITLLDATGTPFQTITYSDNWFPHSDGPGWSLVAADENATADLTTPTSWALSAQIHGNPGAPNGPLFSSELQGWRHQQFTPAELDDPLISGPFASPNGISNLLRYALGLPRSASATDAALSATPTLPLAFTFRRLLHPLDLQYLPESSPDLHTWSPNATPISSTPQNDGTAIDAVRFPADGSRFARLRVILNP